MGVFPCGLSKQIIRISIIQKALCRLNAIIKRCVLTHANEALKKSINQTVARCRPSIFGT